MKTLLMMLMTTAVISGCDSSATTDTPTVSEPIPEQAAPVGDIDYQQEDHIRQTKQLTNEIRAARDSVKTSVAELRKAVEELKKK